MKVAFFTIDSLAVWDRPVEALVLDFRWPRNHARRLAHAWDRRSCNCGRKEDGSLPRYLARDRTWHARDRGRVTSAWWFVARIHALPFRATRI